MPYHAWFPHPTVLDALFPGTLLPPANEVCEGYVFTPVCQSFCSQGGSTWAGTPWAGTPPAGTLLGNACWDTVNKRAVRILLECILVSI